MNIFSKAAQGLPLTPAQRSLLKLMKGILFTALSAGIVAGSQYIFANQQVDWLKLAYAAGGATLLTLLLSLEKYFTASGDTALALGTDAAIAEVKRLVPPPPAPITMDGRVLANGLQPYLERAVATSPQMASTPSITSTQSPSSASISWMGASPMSFGDTGLVPVPPKQQT